MTPLSVTGNVYSYICKHHNIQAHCSGLHDNRSKSAHAETIASATFPPWRERHPVIDRENNALLPAIGARKTIRQPQKSIFELTKTQQ